MLKKIKNFGQILPKNVQREVNGGGKGDVCNNPYLNNDPTCLPGYHPHPTHGICICCAN